MVRCKNCEHNWDSLAVRCELTLAAWSGMEYKNVHGTCKNYKRKWWKFWANEYETKKEILRLQNRRKWMFTPDSFNKDQSTIIKPAEEINKVSPKPKVTTQEKIIEQQEEIIEKLDEILWQTREYKGTGMGADWGI